MCTFCFHSGFKTSGDVAKQLPPEQLYEQMKSNSFKDLKIDVHTNTLRRDRVSGTINTTPMVKTFKPNFLKRVVGPAPELYTYPFGMFKQE